MGVALGVSGVVSNPVRGGRAEGAEGFFKGVGKGLLGLLTKPVGGTVDMISMAFDAIRRLAVLYIPFRIQTCLHVQYRS